MAATPDNGTVDISAEAVVVDDAVSFGFERKEMYTEKLTGSVHPYERHVFLCYKTHEDCLLVLNPPTRICFLSVLLELSRSVRSISLLR